MTAIRSTIGYPFTQDEMHRAYQEYGANCGPIALAFALRIKPDAACAAIPGFDAKRYTSPTMMRQALALLGRIITEDFLADRARMFAPELSLVRVQWEGPWTAPGMNPKWAYKSTHWIAAWNDDLGGDLVFDVNAGIQTFADWQRETVPALTAEIPRATGGWFPTHIWRIEG